MASVQQLIATRQAEIKAFCRQWRITELALIGPLPAGIAEGAADETRLLAAFSPDAEWSLLDHEEMEAHLRRLLGLEVLLLSRRGLEQSPNWVRRDALLAATEKVYACK